MSPARGRGTKYLPLLDLADLFDRTCAELRERAELGEEVLHDPAVADSAPLSPSTFDRFEADVHAATTADGGLLPRSAELDADALIVRATVRTYEWIDELQEAAYRTIGSIAARAIGYLAPQVALGGAIVSAGLIETDALDRDGVAAYLEELAEHNPELLDHVTGGGGLLDGLQMRSLLTVVALAGETGQAAARGGLAAIGAEPFPTDVGSALRDIAGGVVTDLTARDSASRIPATPPRGLADLMTTLSSTSDPVSVQEVGPDRYVAFLSGLRIRSEGGVRMVSGDHSTYAGLVVRAIESALEPSSQPAHVMLVGRGQGGLTAVEIAAGSARGTHSLGFVVEQVVTAGAPSSLVPRVPDPVRVLSLEDRSDPVALLGSLVNADADNRLTVVFDGDGATDAAAYAAGGRLADAASDPDLSAELERLRELGYLVR